MGTSHFSRIPLRHGLQESVLLFFGGSTLGISIESSPEIVLPYIPSGLSIFL